MKNIKKQFHKKTLEIYELGKKYCGYNATRFLQKIRKCGGLDAAKSWLNPKIKTPEGFTKIAEMGRVDISLEALVLRAPWKQLFTADELRIATKRLKDFGYNGVELKEYKVNQLNPEEIDYDGTYTEGTKRQISINAYERNNKARKKCIPYYGAKCRACNFEFGNNYGKEFNGIIQVHHIRPLATIAKEYELDPIKDLIPVCPNCHTIIHKREPPYTIHEMKKMIKKQTKDST